MTCRFPLLITLGFVALAAPRLPAASPVFDKNFGQGTHILRFLLHQKSCTPLTKEAFGGVSPAETLLIVLGNTDFADGKLTEFLEKGGNVLIATNERSTCATNQGVDVSGAIITCPKSQGYREKPGCPYVTPIENADPKLFHDLKQVVANRPSYLLVDPDFLTPLARFPTGAQGFVVPRSRASFAAAGTYKGGGRLLIFADTGIFCNDMVLRLDNDNFTLALRSVDWLIPQGQTKKKVLFLDHGKEVLEFDVSKEGVNVSMTPLPRPQLPKPRIPPEELANMALANADQILADLDEWGFLNQQLVGSHGPQIARTLLIYLTVILLTLGFFRLMKSKHRVDTRVPLSAIEMARGTSGTVMAGRHREMLEKRNLWETAHVQARDCLAQVPGLLEYQRDGKPALPPLKTTGGWQESWALRRQVRYLWRLASGPPRHFGPNELAQLAQQVIQFQDALAGGKLRFEI